MTQPWTVWLFRDPPSFRVGTRIVKRGYIFYNILFTVREAPRGGNFEQLTINAVRRMHPLHSESPNAYILPTAMDHFN